MLSYLTAFVWSPYAPSLICKTCLPVIAGKEIGFVGFEVYVYVSGATYQFLSLFFFFSSSFFIFIFRYLFHYCRRLTRWSGLLFPSCLFASVWRISTVFALFHSSGMSLLLYSFPKITDNVSGIAGTSSPDITWWLSQGPLIYMLPMYFLFLMLPFF